MKCSICGADITNEHYHNADPFKFHGHCCDSCNENLILPVRLFFAGACPNTALWVTPDGHIATKKPKNKKFTYTELQNLVDGYVEVLSSSIVSAYLQEHFYIVVDEEGKLKGAQRNDLAYELLDLNLVGNVLIVPKDLIA